MKTSKQLLLVLLITVGSIFSSQAQLRPAIGPIGGGGGCDDPLIVQFAQTSVDSDCGIQYSVKLPEENMNLFSYKWKVRNTATNETNYYGPFNGDHELFGDHVFDENGTYQICVTVREISNASCSKTICDMLTVSDCEDTPPPGCDEAITAIWCNDYNGPFSNLYPIIVNSSVKLCNPFSHSASGTFSWDPQYFAGIQLAGGTFGNLPAGSSDILPSQFALNANGNANPNGFYIPYKITYVDNVTGAVQVVTLNPLVAPCGDDGGVGNQTPTTGISLTETSIFPNPYQAGETLQIISKDTVGKVSIYNTFGNIVGQYNATNNKVSISENLTEGIYFVQYEVNNQTVSKQLIVKK